jgi:GNAT superfamily N-acetyltransferase
MPAPASGPVIRTMTRDEIAIAIDWAAAEGWNPGLHDADCFHAADPGGFLIGLHDGRPAATISVVRYGDSAGFLGLYIVRPDLRGRGFGLRLWEAGMQRLAGRNVGLDGVVAQQGNYAKSGFALAWRNVRYEGAGGGPMPSDPCIVPIASLPVANVLAYDAPFFPADRSAFLHCWIAQPGAAALAWVEAGALRGYGVLRPCRSGHKVGPLFADTPAISESLYAALAAHAAQGAKVQLDLPEPNKEAIALAQRHGMRPVFQTARMYTGPVPALPLQRIYGITTFELG